MPKSIRSRIFIGVIVSLTASGSIHQLLSNGDFETDKSVVHENGGTLLNYVPSSWSSGFGVSLISSKLFPKYKQGNGDDEIFLAMETASGFISEQLESKKGDLLTLKFSSYSYCITAECATNGLAIYAGSNPHSRANTEMDSDSMIVYDALNTEKDVWVQHTIQFTAPMDIFYLSINAFTEGHRSSGIILDNVACYSDMETYSVSTQTTPHTTASTTTTTTITSSKGVGQPTATKQPAQVTTANTQSVQSSVISASVPLASISKPGTIVEGLPLDKVESANKLDTLAVPEPAGQGPIINPGPIEQGLFVKQEPNEQEFANVKPVPAGLKPRPGPPICTVPVQLLDKWGDGWDEAKLVVSGVSKVIGSSGNELTDSGVARLWPLLLEDKGKYATEANLILNYDGNVSSIRVVSPDLHVPAELWEVLWSVSIGGSLYFGSHKTTMTLQCVNKSATVRSILNGVTHTPCIVCPKLEKPVLSAPFVPLPPSSAKTAPSPPKLARRLLGGPVKPPPLTALTFRVENSFGRGWYNSSVEATEYFISDASRTVLVTSGTLCGPKVRDQCQEKLLDGSYVFRVSGNLDAFEDEQSWEFCGVEGIAQQELTFQISKGRCIPGNLTSAVLEKKRKPKPEPKKFSLEDSISGYTKFVSNLTGEAVYAVSHSTLSADSSSSPSLKFDDGQQYQVSESSSSEQQNAKTLSSNIEAHYRFLVAEVTLVDSILGVGLIVLTIMMVLTIRRRQQQYVRNSNISNKTVCANSTRGDSVGENRRVSFRVLPVGADPKPMAPPHTGKYPRVKRAAIDEDLMDLSSSSSMDLIPDLNL